MRAVRVERAFRERGVEHLLVREVVERRQVRIRLAVVVAEESLVVAVQVREHVLRAEEPLLALMRADDRERLVVALRRRVVGVRDAAAGVVDRLIRRDVADDVVAERVEAERDVAAGHVREVLEGLAHLAPLPLARDAPTLAEIALVAGRQAVRVRVLGAADELRQAAAAGQVARSDADALRDVLTELAIEVDAAEEADLLG